MNLLRTANPQAHALRPPHPESRRLVLRHLRHRPMASAGTPARSAQPDEVFTRSTYVDILLESLRYCHTSAPLSMTSLIVSLSGAEDSTMCI
ncbi:hypothetical protein [Persicitalea sp.]|uniref:hypothetical protein n=1 Tax=Persicitalea sp. TaxID=3100273 RepID=UPI0035942AE4